MADDLSIEVGAHVSEEAVEAVAEALRRLGAGGVAIEARRRSEGFRVRAFFSPRQDPQGKLEELARFVARLPEWGLDPGPGQVWLKEWQAKEWEEAWKAHFHTRRLAPGIWLVPQWEWEEQKEAIPTDEAVILLDPGLAFGTGEHATTQLCAELLAASLQGGESVVDVGTGSGVLAILAHRLGARRVVGIDNDPLAVQAARENLRRNSIEGGVEIREGSLLAGERDIEVVVANLTTGLLEELAPQLPGALKPGARVICSGVSLSNGVRARRALEAAGVRIEEVRERDAWVAFLGVMEAVPGRRHPR